MVAGFKSENALYNVAIFVELKNVRGYIFVALLFYRSKHLFVYQVPHPFSSNFYKDQFKS